MVAKAVSDGDSRRGMPTWFPRSILDLLPGFLVGFSALLSSWFRFPLLFQPATSEPGVAGTWPDTN